MIIDEFCSWIDQRNLNVVLFDILENPSAKVDRAEDCPQKPNVSALDQGFYVSLQLRNARQSVLEDFLNLHQAFSIDGECERS